VITQLSALTSSPSYYRARYYHPQLQRFISEDGIGFFNGSGTNLYQYVGSSPSNGTDPSGFWSPEAHDALIRHALQPCGVSPEQIHQIQQGSRMIDDETGTSEEYAYIHSMAAPGQSAQDAEDMRNGYIGTTLQVAQDIWASNPDFALRTLGDGIHPAMDFTSPAHTYPNNTPITWCSPIGCSGNRVHSPWDWMHLGIERTPDITPEDYALEDQAIRDAYSYVTGAKLSCRKQ
jgi:RHS repeat-associated protein